MGKVFTYVADNALKPALCCGPHCQCCDRADVAIFNYMGTIISPERAADPVLAREYPDVEALCADCINGDAVEKFFDKSIESLISRFATDQQAVWEEFHKLPDMPSFAQHFDWPLCCGMWCEFMGHPENLAELIEIQRTHTYWHLGRTDGARDFANEGEPEGLWEISRFQCPSCARKYYIDQFT